MLGLWTRKVEAGVVEANSCLLAEIITNPSVYTYPRGNSLVTSRCRGSSDERKVYYLACTVTNFSAAGDSNVAFTVYLSYIIQHNSNHHTVIRGAFTEKHGLGGPIIRLIRSAQKPQASYCVYSFVLSIDSTVKQNKIWVACRQFHGKAFPPKGSRREASRLDERKRKAVSNVVRTFSLLQF